MSDLAAFLNARLDEDERYIRAMKAAGERYRDNATSARTVRDSPMVRELFDAMLDDQEVVAAATAVQKSGAPNDLDRLLREVEAKRKILAQRDLMHANDEWHAWWLDEVIVMLAAVYSDHPDYDPAWA